MVKLYRVTLIDTERDGLASLSRKRTAPVRCKTTS